VELRGGGSNPKIGGYAAVFDKPSQNLGGFVEIVTRSFFAKSRGDNWPDVMARYNHDDNMLLGTTGAGTLRLVVDDVGLDYEVMPPQARKDVVELVQRGDVRKSSFAFRIQPAPDGSPGDVWSLSDQGYPTRSLVAGQLVDVAPVNAPAYLDSTAGLRSLAEKFEADEEEVRSLATQNELRKFFIRTDGPGPKPRSFAASAAAALLARRTDPWE